MTHRDRSPDYERALERVVDEVRDERTPIIDWERVEARLLARVARDEAPRFAPRTERSVLARVATYAAAAAVVALGLGASAGHGPRGPSARPPHAVDPASVALVEGGDHDFTRLAVGDAIETSAEPVTFGEAGSVRWTLAPSSRAIVRAKGVGGVGHVVTLERGSLRAEVVPRDPSEGLVEAFAVEVGGTRVAVHGTLFTVAHAGDHAVVDVEHGAVAIGPIGHVGATTGRLLVGPARARFSLDGGRSAFLLPRDASVEPTAPLASSQEPTTQAASHGSALSAGDASPAAPRAQHPAVAAAHPVSAAAPQAEPAAPEPAVVAEPAPAVAAPVYLTEASLRAHLGQCVAETVGSSAVVQSVSSTFRLQVRADGTIQSARFDPPLKGDMQACAGRVLGGRFETGPQALAIPVSFKR